MKTVKTPIDALNIVGLGGLRFSTICELYGENKSGKSSFAYQTAGMFLEQYPNGRVLLIDPELSHDSLRLEYVFKWDFSRVDIEHATTVEDIFNAILKAIDTCKTELLIIPDTISACPTKEEFDNTQDFLSGKKKETDMWAGGRNIRQRVIKYHLTQLMARLYQRDVLILLPNQVYKDQSMFSKTGVISGGGEALKHDLHYSLFFKTIKNEMDDSKKNTLKSIKSVSLIKSRFAPEIINIPAYIDVAAGGAFDVRHSTMLLCQELGMFQQTGPRWIIPGYSVDDNGKEKSFFWKDIYNDPDVYAHALKMLEDYYEDKYVMIKKMKEIMASRAATKTKKV